LTAIDRASLVAVAALIAVILAGMWQHGLIRLCRTFAAYLIAVGLVGALIALWPGRFYNWAFWQVKELAFSVLAFFVALEVSALAFQAFPGARARARQLSLLILLATLAAIALAPVDVSSASRPDVQAILYVELQPRLAHGTLMLLAAVWALVLWYVIPLHRWHRAILRGLVPYMVVFTGAVRLVAALGREHPRWVGYADSLAYILMLVYWAWEAWRSDPVQPPPEILSRLQPWLDRS
jgi:hypothetical protein